MLIGALALTVGAVLVAVFAFRDRRDLGSAAGTWQAAVNQLGLKFQRVEDHRRIWRGRVDGMWVQAEVDLAYQGGNFLVRLIAGAEVAIPRNLEVYSDSLLRSVGRVLDGEDHAIGDAAFDDVALLPTLDAKVCAALSHGTRSQLATLLSRGGQVREGRVALDIGWSAQCDGSTLAQHLRWLSRVARLLSVPHESLHQRLAQNALRDPAPAVRLQNLRFLAAAETRTPPALVAHTARALLYDVHAPVRLLAARQLGAEGLSVLSQMLGAGNPAQLICDVLAVLELQRARTPIDGLSLDAVLGCTHSEHEKVRLAASQLLGKWARAEAEPALLALLADSSPYVQLASTQALASFGSIAAVEHLLPLAQALLDSQLRQAARGAVGSIQARLGNVEAGRLSLAAGHELAGAVELADGSAARSGELSLSEDETQPHTALTR